jgi:hypothetical protein
MQNPNYQAESSVIPTESGIAIEDIGNEDVVPTSTTRAPAIGQENQDHRGRSLPMIPVDCFRAADLPRQLLRHRGEPKGRHDTRRNNASDARKPAPVNNNNSTLQDDATRLYNDGDNSNDSKRTASMHPVSEPVPKRAEKSQNPPGLSYTSQNAANDGDRNRKPAAIDTAPKPQCDEVHAVESRLIPLFAGLDTASDAGNTEARVVGKHIRQTCCVHNFVAVNNGVTTQEWLDSNKEYCPGCHCFVCEIEASKCPHWSVHCCADMNGPWGDIWRTQREAARVVKSADDLIFNDGNNISSRVDDENYDVGEPEDDALATGGQGLEAVPPVAGNRSNESPDADALLEQLGPLIAGELLMPSESVFCQNIEATMGRELR